MRRLWIALLALLIFGGLLFAVNDPVQAACTGGIITGSGFYDDLNSCFGQIPASSWTVYNDVLAFSGSFSATSTQGRVFNATVTGGTRFYVYILRGPSGSSGNVCVGGLCQVVSFYNASLQYGVAIQLDVNCQTINCSFSLTHTGANGTFAYIDGFGVDQQVGAVTPLPTWTNQVITPLATWTAQPTNRAFTPLPTWTNQVITPLATWTVQPTERAFTPLPTWTNQVITPLATWTAQSGGLTPLPTWTAQGRSQYVLTNGFYYEELDAGLNFVGAWSLDISTDYANNRAYTTTTQSAYMSFTFSGRLAYLIIKKLTTGDDIQVCIDSCVTVEANDSNTNNFSVLIGNGLALENTVVVRKLNNNANPIYIDAVSVSPWETLTPLPTWTPYPTVRAYTQIPPLTEIPQFTQIAPLTQIPPLTEIPQFTQIAPYTPLPTWTAQPGAFTPLPTWTPYLYPTPLDTWTPQAVAQINVTIQTGLTANIDWNGLLTIFPTLITQVPPTNTPTETLTPSITPTPSDTPTLTPPGLLQFDLPNAQGTIVATGVLHMEATAGDLANNGLLFVIASVSLLGIAYSFFQARKPPQ